MTSDGKVAILVALIGAGSSLLGIALEHTLKVTEWIFPGPPANFEECSIKKISGKMGVPGHKWNFVMDFESGRLNGDDGAAGWVRGKIEYLCDDDTIVVNLVRAEHHDQGVANCTFWGTKQGQSRASVSGTTFCDHVSAEYNKLQAWEGAIELTKPDPT